MNRINSRLNSITRAPVSTFMVKLRASVLKENTQTEYREEKRKESEEWRK